MMFGKKVFVLMVASALFVGCMAETEEDLPTTKQIQGSVAYQGVAVAGAEVVATTGDEPDSPSFASASDDLGHFSLEMPKDLPICKVQAAVELDGKLLIGEALDPGELDPIELREFTEEEAQEAQKSFDLEVEGVSTFVGYKGWGCACHKQGKYFGKLCCGYYELKKPQNATFCSIPLPFVCYWK